MKKENLNWGLGVILTIVFLFTVNHTDANNVVKSNEYNFTPINSKICFPHTHNILLDAKVFKNIEFNMVKTVEGVSGMTLNKIDVLERESKSHKEEYRFNHGEKISLEFKSKLNSDKFSWKVKETSDLLGLSAINGEGSVIEFVSENQSEESKTITIEVTAFAGLQEITEEFVLRICPKISPTFTESPSYNDGNNYNTVTYRTEDGFENYVWKISGELNKDYTKVAGGLDTDNFLQIVWLTKGKKEVAVKYTSDKDNFEAIDTKCEIEVTKLGHIYKVGDRHLGGTIYRVFGTPGRQYGYVVANDELKEQFWTNNNDFDQASGVSNGIENSNLIINNCEGESAAKSCSEFLKAENGVLINDWYLPAIAELKNIARALPGELNGEYWSSTQCRTAKYHALALNEEGDVLSSRKNSNSFKLKPVRKFSFDNEPCQLNTKVNYEYASDNMCIVKMEAYGGEAPYVFTYSINGEKHTIQSETNVASLEINVNDEIQNVLLQNVQHGGDGYIYEYYDTYVMIPANSNEVLSTQMAVLNVEEE